jgi:hypothetical protein
MYVDLVRVVARHADMHGITGRDLHLPARVRGDLSIRNGHVHI